MLVNWEHLQFFVPFSSIYNFGVLQSALIFFFKEVKHDGTHQSKLKEMFIHTKLKQLVQLKMIALKWDCKMKLQRTEIY